MILPGLDPDGIAKLEPLTGFGNVDSTGLDPDGMINLKPLTGFGNIIGNVDSTRLKSRWDSKA